jgi:hypothetical protein
MSPATIRMQMVMCGLRCYSGLLTYRDEHPASAVDLMQYCDFTISSIMDNCHAASTKHTATPGSVEHMGNSSRVRGRRKQKQMQRRGGSARLE